MLLHPLLNIITKGRLGLNYLRFRLATSTSFASPSCLILSFVRICQRVQQKYLRLATKKMLHRELKDGIGDKQSRNDLTATFVEHHAPSLVSAKYDVERWSTPDPTLTPPVPTSLVSTKNPHGKLSGAPKCAAIAFVELAKLAQVALRAAERDGDEDESEDEQRRRSSMPIGSKIAFEFRRCTATGPGHAAQGQVWLVINKHYNRCDAVKLKDYCEAGTKFVEVETPLQFHDFRSVLEAAHGPSTDCQEVVVTILSLEWGKHCHNVARATSSTKTLALHHLCMCSEQCSSRTKRLKGPTTSGRPKPPVAISAETVAMANKLLYASATAGDQQFCEDEAVDLPDEAAMKFFDDVKDVEELEAQVELDEDKRIHDFEEQHPESNRTVWLDVLKRADDNFKTGRTSVPPLPAVNVLQEDIEREAVLSAALCFDVVGEDEFNGLQSSVPSSFSHIGVSASSSSGQDVVTASSGSSGASGPATGPAAHRESGRTIAQPVRSMGRASLIQVLQTWTDAIVATTRAGLWVKEHCRDELATKRSMSLVLVHPDDDSNREVLFVHWGDFEKQIGRKVRITKLYMRIVYTPPGAKLKFIDIPHRVLLRTTTTEMIRVSQHSAAAPTMPEQIMRQKSYLEHMHCCARNSSAGDDDDDSDPDDASLRCAACGQHRSLESGERSFERCSICLLFWHPLCQDAFVETLGSDAFTENMTKAFAIRACPLQVLKEFQAEVHAENTLPCCKWCTFALNSFRW